MFYWFIAFYDFHHNELRCDFDIDQTLSGFERVYFKTLVLQSLGELEINSSSYTNYFNTSYYSMYSLLSSFSIISDSIIHKSDIPQWWYEINKSVESVSVYEFVTNNDSDIQFDKFIDKLVHLNKRIHYYLAIVPEGDYNNSMRLINRRMKTVISSAENTLDALLDPISY